MNLNRINENPNREALVNNFIQSAGDSLSSFRYFEKRDISIINEHHHTVLLYSGQEIIGYGHLDPCDLGKVWLGICLKSGHTGKGLGKMIMKNLTEYADASGHNQINLSVDISNVGGKKLYEQFGFKVYNKTESMYFMKRRRNV